MCYDWSMNIFYLQDNLFDLQFQYPCAIGGGEAGIETDGCFFYTTMWNGADFHKYNLNGNYVSTFDISGAGNVRDLAFDGSYFYGAAASPTVFEMDFSNQILISTFNAPTEVRAIAYNENDDAFYANNWGSDIVKFDKKLARTKLARPLLLAAVLGIFYIAANVVHGLLFISQFTPRFLLGNLPIGFLLGLGIGLGAEISETITKK